MSKREILAYAITHAGYDAAGKAIKGGPYMPACFQGPVGGEVPLDRAARFPTSGHAVACIALNRKVLPATARVIRIVRKARPSRLCDACGFLIEAESRRRTPSEASAVEVLRELVASLASREGLNLSDLASRARRVLAASGPDPMPVVRAAMAWSEATAANGTARTVALQLACVAHRKAGGKS